MEEDIDAAVEYLANNIINAARSSIQKLEYITQHEYPDAIKKKSKINGSYEDYGKIAHTQAESKQRNQKTQQIFTKVQK